MKYIVSPDGRCSFLKSMIVGLGIGGQAYGYRIELFYKVDNNAIQSICFMQEILNLEIAKKEFDKIIKELNEIEPEGRSLDNTRKVEL